MNVKKLGFLVLCGITTLMWNTSVAQNLHASFKPSSTKMCGTSTVTFTDESTGDIDEWTWDYGNGTVVTYTERKPLALAYEPGTYTVKLTVKNATEQDSYSQDIIVYEAPQPKFVLQQFDGCTDTKFTFVDSSVAATPIVSRSWSFGDGTGSTEQNPSHTYTIAGKYVIGLTVTDENNCKTTASIKDAISVTKPLTININADAKESCAAPLTTTFTPLISNGTAAKFAWNFGDGNSSEEENPTNTYISDGSFSVTLAAETETGCRSEKTFTDFIKINTYDATISQSGALCVGSSVNFSGSANSTTNKWEWDFGNGNTSSSKNASTTFASAGNYTVKLIATSSIGCVSEKTMEVTVFDNPTVEISGNDGGETSSTELQGCAETAYSPQFSTTTANITSYLWNLGNGLTSTEATPTATYDAEGTYAVSLQATDNHGCTSMSSSLMITLATPTAEFEISSSEGENYCLTSTVSITDKSSSKYGLTASSYSWRFDYDQSKETNKVTNNQDFTLQYTESGLYPIELTITDNKGCTASYSDTVRMGKKPDFVSIDIPDQCYSKNGVSIEASATANQWKFEFGDGQDSIYKADGTITLIHIYDEPNTYEVKLIAKDNECPSDEVLKSFTIKPPKANFTFTPQALCFFPGEMTFDPSESKGAEEYFWDFGDASTNIYVKQLSEGHFEWKENDGAGTIISADSSVATPTHEFQIAQDYTVTLITKTAECADTLPTMVNMSGIYAGFTQDTIDVCLGTPIAFSDTSKVLNGSIVSRQWIFDTDTLIASSRSITYTFPQAGTFDVALKVENSYGCKDSLLYTKKILVRDLPQIIELKSLLSDEDSIAGCHELEVPFYAKTKEASAAVTSFEWSFGDGTSSTEALPTHIYNVDGLYDISLKITDAKNCSSDSTRVKYVQLSNPTPIFSIPAMVCSYNTVTTTNNSKGSHLQYLWEWGDETTESLEVTPSHVFDLAMCDTTFTISLTANDTLFNCANTASQTIAVRSPQAEFIASDSVFDCPPADVNFTNMSKGTNITSSSWEFFDGSLPSKVTDAYWKYYTSGVYDVQLMVEDDFGCKDTTTKVGYITVRGPRGNFIISQTEGCTYDTIQFKATDVVGATNRRWIYGDGIYEETGDVDSSSYTYPHGNYYTPTLVLADDAGCEVTIIGTKITIFGVDLDFISDSILCNTTDLLDLNNTSIASPVSVDEWTWIFSSGDTVKAENASLSFDYGFYDMSLIADIHSCQYRLDSTKFLQVLRALDVEFSTTQNPAKALETVQFTNLTDTAYSLPVFIEWNFDDGKTVDTYHTSHTFMQPGTYNVSLLSYIHEECPNTFVLPLTVTEQYLIPNVFTPNGDGVNDYYLEDMEDVQLIIINRWGQKIYEGKGGWDGTYNGTEMSAGTYFYMITLPNGEEFEGPVMLIRN